MATGTWRFYGEAVERIVTGAIDFTGTIKTALLATGYTPNYGTHYQWSDVSAYDHSTSGTGYAAGGRTHSTKVYEYVPASSAVNWSASQTWKVGDMVANAGDTAILQCVVGGAGGTGSEPSWNTTYYGQPTTDGSATWMYAGKGYVRYDEDDDTWASSTISAYYAVVYDATNSLLIGNYTFDSPPISSDNGTFTVAHRAIPNGSGHGYIFAIPVWY